MTQVIYIDDNDMLRKAALSILARWYHVVVFESPRAALQHIEPLEVGAVIVCDYDMPELNGLDVYERLSEPHRERFILFTGNTAVQSPSGYTLYKPASFALLREVIEAAI